MRVIHVHQRKFENTEEYKVLAKKNDAEKFLISFSLLYTHVQHAHSDFLQNKIGA